MITFDKIKNDYQELNNKLLKTNNGQEINNIYKAIAEIEDVYNKIISQEELNNTIEFLQTMLLEATNEVDKNNITSEIEQSNTELEQINKEITNLLQKKDPDDNKNIIIEIRPAAGGDEAGLFTAELFHMYQKYAQSEGWGFEIYTISENSIGLYKEATALISGNNIFQKMKYEAGVHRVQRIPQTETQGRIHTSTVTVAILPEVSQNIEINIPDKDIRIDTFRSSGAGGQHVNTTDSAVRVTHLPTGITVIQQQKSQHNNKTNAMKILKSKLYDLERAKKNENITSNRQSQIGTGSRSEKIRTYNFPQSRITDHRINFNHHKLNEFITEGKIKPMLQQLLMYYNKN